MEKREINLSSLIIVLGKFCNIKNNICYTAEKT